MSVKTKVTDPRGSASVTSIVSHGSTSGPAGSEKMPPTVMTAPTIERPVPRAPAGGGTRPSMGHRPALDGIRAIAVVAVVLFHFDFAWIPGGFLGVDVFFVVSGYLITTLMIEEWERSGGIDRRQFWLRRGRRLLPALYLMLLVTCAWACCSCPTPSTGSAATSSPPSCTSPTGGTSSTARPTSMRSAGRPSSSTSGRSPSRSSGT